MKISLLLTCFLCTASIFCLPIDIDTETMGALPGKGTYLPEEARHLFPGEPACIFDETPAGLSDATNLQVFTCVYDKPIHPGVACPTYHIKTFLVGRDAAVPFEGSHSLLWLDMDGDTTFEVLSLSYGVTGRFTEILSLYGIQDGSPVLRAQSWLLLDPGTTCLVEENDEPWYQYIPSETFSHGKPLSGRYRVLLENGSLSLEGAEESGINIIYTRERI